MASANVQTFAHLEKACGLANGSIGKWKSGAYKPSLDYLVKLANYFDCTLDYLVGRSDSPKAQYGDN